MSLLLEIVGKAIAVDVSELIRHWLDMVTGDGGRGEQLSEVIELMCAKKYESAEKQLRVYVDCCLYHHPDISCSFKPAPYLAQTCHNHSAGNIGLCLSRNAIFSVSY